VVAKVRRAPSGGELHCCIHGHRTTERSGHRPCFATSSTLLQPRSVRNIMAFMLLPLDPLDSHSNSSMTAIQINRNSCPEPVFSHCPMSLGIGTLHGLVLLVVPAGTALPCSASQVVCASADERCMAVSVYQGESPCIVHNLFLGT
jgi:hypothetical protein